MTAIAVDTGATTSQLAFAWRLSRGEHIVPIPGRRNPKRLEKNIAATAVDLAADVVRSARPSVIVPTVQVPPKLPEGLGSQDAMTCATAVTIA